MKEKFPLGKVTRLWLVVLQLCLTGHTRAALAGGTTQNNELPVPDDCVSAPYEDGLELRCSLSAINSVDERTNFAVIPSAHTLSLVVTCREEATLSRLEPEAFSSLASLRSLELRGCRFEQVPEKAFFGLSVLRKLTIMSTSNRELSIDKDAFLGLGALEELNLPGNRLRLLPAATLCPLRWLRSLNVSHNALRDLTDLGGLECLQHLESADFSHNELSSTELSERVSQAWRQLRSLSLTANRLRAVQGGLLRGQTELAHFEVSHNRLTTLPVELFADCRSLRSLGLANNTLQFLPSRLLLGPAARLESLDLSSNELDNVPDGLLAPLGRLEALDVSGNRLTSLDAAGLRGLKRLRRLRAAGNALARVSLPPLPDLQILDLSRNALRRLPGRLLGRLGRLRQLRLDANQLDEVPRRVLSNLTELAVLDLSDNRLRAVPEGIAGLTGLQSLALTDNRIGGLPAEPPLALAKLWRLQLAGNRLENVSVAQLSGLPALQVLDLSRNAISSVESGAFSACGAALQALRLDANRLSRMEHLFAGLAALSWLNVSANSLTVFDYAMLPASLQWLDLHANEIPALENFFGVEEARLARLTHIDASFNRLVELGPASFPDRVETLLLNDNQISSLLPYTFFKKTRLRKVDLSVNRLAAIDHNALRLNLVHDDEDDDDDNGRPRFFLGGNPIRCDCHMAWFTTVNAAPSYPVVADLEAIYCELVHGRGAAGGGVVPLVEASPSQLVCAYKTHCFALCHCCDYDACDCEMTCPSNCTCYHDPTWTTNVAECSAADFRDLPDQLPMDATEVFLDGNTLGRLRSHTFIGRKNLVALYLNASRVTAVDNHTFNGLAALRALHLEANAIAELQGDEFHGLAGLAELYLHDNLLSSVADATFAGLAGLRVLSLHGNRLAHFAAWRLAANAELATLTLADNRWSCDCRFLASFRRFVSPGGGGGVVADADAIACVAGNGAPESLLKLQVHGACSSGDSADGDLSALSTQKKNATGSAEAGDSANALLHEVLPVAVSCASLVLLLAGCVCVACFCYGDSLRVWLHSRYGVRFFHRIDAQGRNDAGGGAGDCKLYDAFVVHSAADEAFVRQILAAELERPQQQQLYSTSSSSGSGSGSSGGGSCGGSGGGSGGGPGYRLCLLYRDLLHAPAEGLVSASEASHCHVLVVSQALAEQEWSRYDTRASLHQVLGHARRLVVVLLGADLVVDDDLRLYMKAAAVLRWGEKAFWEKLRAALPDVRHRTARRTALKVNQQQMHLLSTSGFTPDTSSFRYEAYPGQQRMAAATMSLQHLGHNAPSAGLPPAAANGSVATMGGRSVGGDSSIYQSISTPDEQDSTRTMTIHI